jgi:acetyl-CoA acetyltransferase
MPKAAEQVYAMAGVDRSEIDALMIYDSFSINIWLSLENFGFCKPGEAGDYTQGGRIALGGDLPINTHGGHLSDSYMQGWLHQVEAVRQLRGEAGARQVPDARHVQYICRGNLCTTMIYRRDA